MNSDELKDIEQKMRNARTMDELYEEVKNITGDDLTDQLASTLHSDMSTVHQWMTHPRRMTHTYIYQYTSFSTELMVAIDAWSADTLQSLTENKDDLIQFMDTSMDELAAIMADFHYRYYTLGGEISSVVTELKSFPKYLKQVIDAYSDVAKSWEDAKEIAYKYCDLLDISHEDFDTKVAKKLISRAKYPKSAGDKDAQPTE